jgi:hypothetical protein
MRISTHQVTAGVELDRPQLRNNSELVRWIAERAGVDVETVERSRQSRTSSARRPASELNRTRARVSAALDRPNRLAPRSRTTRRPATTNPAARRAARYEEQLSR